MTIKRTEKLSNGLTVEFHDRSNRYYGDFHRVRIEVRCSIPLTPAVITPSEDPEAELRRVRDILGEEVVFTRFIERMGVAGDALEQTKRHLIDSFTRSAFAYLENPAFPSRLVARELERRKKVRRPFGIVE
jgi:hypothetical protein